MKKFSECGLLPFLLLGVLLLGGCLSYRHIPYHGASCTSFSHRPAVLADSGFEYQKAIIRPVLIPEKVFDTLRYRSFFLSMPSIGENGQEHNLVTARYYQSRSENPVRKKLIIILPIWGSSKFPPDMVMMNLTEWSSESDTNVLVVKGEKDIFDWKALGNAPTEPLFFEEIQRSVEKIRTTIIDTRHLIDFAETQPDIDISRIGIVGFSVGAVAASLVMGVDSRISAGVFIMGGGNLHEIFAFSDASDIRRAREKILSRFGWTQELFREKLRGPLWLVNPVYYAQNINPQKVLILDALFDNYIPRSARDELWQALCQPERVTFPYTHQASFVRSITIVGLNFTDRAIAAFFQKHL